mmetsp:Transcript_20909/g.52842  ORF Transcript_20909/g.52842 Transcript_20909/m.52842 type:complete len:225 (-) Transcript_20909:513-1187(-)
MSPFFRGRSWCRIGINVSSNTEVEVEEVGRGNCQIIGGCRGWSHWTVHGSTFVKRNTIFFNRGHGSMQRQRRRVFLLSLDVEPELVLKMSQKTRTTSSLLQTDCHRLRTNCYSHFPLENNEPHQDWAFASSDSLMPYGRMLSGFAAVSAILAAASRPITPTSGAKKFMCARFLPSSSSRYVACAGPPVSSSPSESESRPHHSSSSSLYPRTGTSADESSSSAMQ